MTKQFFICTIIISVLLESCCSKDNNIPYAPQSVVIKSYGGVSLTKINSQGKQDNIQVTTQNGLKLDIMTPQTIIDQGDTLFVINPYYSSSGGEFNPSVKALLVNKIFNRVDTLNVKFSLKRIDACNENVQIDEATLNGKKGDFRKVTSLYGDVIELKFK